MDFPYLNDVVEKMKFKNRGISRDSVTGKIEYPGWIEGVYDEYWSGPNMDFLGSNFAPFHHNYLYGWSIVDIVETNFRAMNEDKAARKIMVEAFADMDQKVGGSSSTPQFLTYVQDHGGHHLLLLVRAFQFSLIPFEESTAASSPEALLPQDAAVHLMGERAGSGVDLRDGIPPGSPPPPVSS